MCIVKRELSYSNPIKEMDKRFVSDVESKISSSFTIILTDIFLKQGVYSKIYLACLH